MKPVDHNKTNVIAYLIVYFFSSQYSTWPGVNFINIPQAAFVDADLKTAKKTDN